MDEDNFETKIESARAREKRYQWVITTILIFTAFMGGMLVQTERLKTQVVTNTVEIRIIKEGLHDIDVKLDKVLAR